MRSVKKTLALLLACFFAFAPPGTLIFLAILALAFINTAPLAAAIVSALIILAAALLFYKRAASK